MSIPLSFKPEQIKAIKDYIWICPAEFAPSFTYINDGAISNPDQTVWIFDDINELGYAKGKFYSLIGTTYSYGYINGSISLIDGKVVFNFNNISSGSYNTGRGQYFIPKNSCQRPYFALQTITETTILQTNPIVFDNFVHNAGAIAILPGEKLYNKLPFSTPQPNLQISVPEFIKKCTE